jgi:hypothetical protein
MVRILGYRESSLYGVVSWGCLHYIDPLHEQKVPQTLSTDCVLWLLW